MMIYLIKRCAFHSFVEWLPEAFHLGFPVVPSMIPDDLPSHTSWDSTDDPGIPSSPIPLPISQSPPAKNEPNSLLVR